MVTIFDMHTHILAIALNHNVTIEWRKQGGRGWRKAKRISIAPVRSDITYAIALHELGHVIGPQSGRRIDHELQAWQWAKDNALIWSDVMARKRDQSLTSYARWAMRRQRNDKRGREFIHDNHPIWMFVERKDV